MIRLAVLLALAASLALVASAQGTTRPPLLERQAHTLRGGTALTFQTTRVFAPTDTIQVTVTVDGRDPTVKTYGGQVIQYVARGVLVVVKAPTGPGPMIVRAANLRASTVHVVAEFRR